jgi:hypothetical protein
MATQASQLLVLDTAPGLVESGEGKQKMVDGGESGIFRYQGNTLFTEGMAETGQRFNLLICLPRLYHRSRYPYIWYLTVASTTTMMEFTAAVPIAVIVKTCQLRCSEAKPSDQGYQISRKACETKAQCPYRT